MKLERANPGGSIKDRIALSMIEDAEEHGILKQNSVIIEPTSGNTGIGLAMVAAVKGYKLILVMPESMSVERRRILAAYGATLELTPREKGMKGAIERANELAAKTPNAWIPQQFENPSNIEVHERTTAQEIIRDFPGGIDYLITGVGTGGHITGCANALKKKFPNVKVFAVEPSLSPVISGGAPSPHPTSGNRRRFHPKESSYGNPGWSYSGIERGSFRVYCPSRKGGRNIPRYFIRCCACCSCKETSGDSHREHGTDVRLRYRRAIFVC